jgi:hypothetical protein
MKYLNLTACTALLVAPVLAGCGGGDANLPVAKATGIVTYQGKAVSGASVTFIKEGSTRTGTGITNAEGRFEISTYANNDGALIGDNVVTVIKKAAGDSAAAPMTQPKSPEEMAKAMRAFSEKEQKPADEKKTDDEVPVRYGSAAGSPLKAIVSSDASKNNFKFELVD